MKKRIFTVITAMVMTAIVVLGIVMTSIYYGFYKTQSENDVKAIANFFVQADNDHDAIGENLIKNFPYEIRITLIDKDGNVKFDTKKNVVFENHLNREEVQEAFKTGEGEAKRKSETLGKNAYYYAIKYGNNEVIRFSRELDNISSMFISVLPFLVVAAFLVVVISTIIASKLSDSIIKPVNTLVEKLNIFDKKDTDTNILDTEYDELRPIARKVKDLTGEADSYIAQLKNEKATINLITDNMVEGMILLDNGLNILSVNRSAISILNHDFVLDKTKNILQLTRNNDIISIIEAVKADKINFGNTVINQGQNHYKVFVNQATSKNSSYGIIVLLVDVTESIKVEEIRRDFAANVSHELKTPLTTIKGFGEMLSAGIISEKPDITRYGSTIYRESERLLLLINDIIRLSEIEEVGNIREKTPVNLLECANEAKNILAKVAADKGVAVEVEGDIAVINGNKSYLDELVLNLTDNAIKYNNKSGYVKIIVNNFDDRIVLIVKDNGIGIPKEHQERIFERFYRVDKSRSKQTGGTGLGLSIVKHIVYYHNGKISLVSDENNGTEISVVLPK